MSELKLVIISGSLRKGSFNRMLLAEAACAFGPASVSNTNLRLPLYDGDLEDAAGIPADVQTLAAQIAEADAVIIASPEYNKGIPGVLKNALDWVSRLETPVFKDKPVAVISAAAGRTGGETAQYMVLSCLVPLQAQVVQGPAVLVAGAHAEFDEDGKLTSDLYRKNLTARMQALRAVAQA